VWHDAVAHVSSNVNAKSLYLTPGTAEVDAAGGAEVDAAGGRVALGATLLAIGAAVAAGGALLATGAVVATAAPAAVPGGVGESVPAHATTASPNSTRRIEE
jgi:hypothetical protein